MQTRVEKWEEAENGRWQLLYRRQSAPDPEAEAFAGTLSLLESHTANVAAKIMAKTTTITMEKPPRYHTARARAGSF